MKSVIEYAALIAATAQAVAASSCVQDPFGNYYCQESTGITYTGVGGAGSYNKVTSMNTADTMSSDGTCTSEAFGYSGSMSPLDEEVR